MKEQYTKPELKKQPEKIQIFEKLLAEFTEKLKNLPELDFINDFYKEFPDSNFYLVGGMVRDAARGTQILSKDFDFVVNKINIDDLTSFLESKGKVNLVGKNFGVIKFQPKGVEMDEPIDIALPRTEFSVGEGGGYKDFEVQADPSLPIEKDLARRDLTINALALDIKTGKIVDPYNGLQDLAKNKIKTVENPADRFKEDYSRMLRAIRFAVRFGFDLEENTENTIRKLAPHINDKRENDKGKDEYVVPRETIAKEFLKTLQTNPVKTAELYDKLGFLGLLIPEIRGLKDVKQEPQFHQEGDVWNHTMLTLKTAKSQKFLDTFDKEPPLDVLVALLLHDIGKPPLTKTIEKDGQPKIISYGHEELGAEISKKILNRLKLSSYNGIIDNDIVNMLVLDHMKYKGKTLKEMSSSKLSAKFLKDPVYGEKLKMVLYCDEQASIMDKPTNDFKILTDRLTEIEKNTGKKIKLLVDGKDIMNLEITDITGEKVKIPPGKIIGQLKTIAEEAQLNGKIKNKQEGLELLKDYLTTPEGQELLNQSK